MKRWRELLLALAVFLFSAVALAQLDAPPSATAEATEAVASPAMTATAIAAIELVEHNVLQRPIELSADLVHWEDRTYPYGSTQQGARAVHLGVEFVNPRFTPVYAAKAGLVVFAGDDSTTLLGPQLDYYGNVVILAHELDSLAGEQIFTLYGHLERVEVETGQTVDELDRIGRVGATGIAIGAHLHFEVRAAKPFDYRATRNPALWLQHYFGRGLIIGAVRDAAGEPIFERRLTVRSPYRFREVFTYGSERVNSDLVWGENFSVSDLPAGEYEVIVSGEYGGIGYRETVEVLAYRTTFLDITLAE